MTASTPTTSPRTLFRTRTVLEMIKFQHTVFALPFAVVSAVMAARGAPSLWQCVWVLVAMVGARSAAMAFNRLADRRLDAANPRTQDRALPRGTVAPAFVALFTAASAGLFVLAAGMLNRTCLLMSPVVLAVLLGYSYSKRFTWLSHLWLGAALGLAPMGAWVAVRGQIAAEPVLLGVAVTLWTAGFDLIYACQDVAFDRRNGLHAVPARFGVPAALRLSILLHVATVLLLMMVYAEGRMGVWYLGGVALVGGLLTWEHLLVSRHDLSRVNAAFFTVNGFISIIFMLATIVDVLV